MDVVFPIHPNPNVKSAYDEVLATNSFVHVISPVNYGCMVGLINLCELVISDSGGIQEEAPYAGKFTLISRDTSERMEVVDQNYALLVGTETERILDGFEKWYRGDFKFESHC
jgi:UDP-N-acetylglucosamine 2-epimerase (non-hydrolysing)